jgi:formylglycine-generating enzyme required for sulfatase activity
MHPSPQKRSITVLLLALVLIPLLALKEARAQSTDGIRISQVQSKTFDYPNRYYVFTVEWSNAWHTDKNHDAAWVFLKALGDSDYEHISILPGSVEMLWKEDEQMPDAAIEVSEDSRGLFVYASEKYRGDLKYRVQVKIDTAKVDMDDLIPKTPGAYGIEMVQIPKSGFTLGDPDTTALSQYAFYRSGKNGSYDGLYEIKSERQAINVGTNPGDLYYRSDNATYRGDQKGPIPAEFPKGVESFYIMKYEVSQGDYVKFLNSLGSHDASIHYPGGMPEYRQQGGSIKLEDGKFVADRPDQRMLFWHWDDMMAYTDWTALRPYTEFEFTKAARGPSDPIPGEYAWNTNRLTQMSRRIDSRDQRMKMNRDISLSEMTDQNREIFGASYYWVFDLSGSMWEKVITVGDSVGRAFTGQHGDGIIDGNGFANVEEWPEGYADSEGGYGYRGGGYYGENWISRTNPYPPIAYRPFASWSAGTRNEAYGYRAARTAPK